MPELPEVETVRKGMNDRLEGFCIERLEVCRERAIASLGGSKKFIKKMSGNIVGVWQRRGKYLIASLHQTIPQGKKALGRSNLHGWLGVHLRMTGQFQWHEKKLSPCPHTRVRFWNNSGQELRFVDIRSFGQMWWVPPQSCLEEVITGLSKLGPEPFSESFTIGYLKDKLKRTNRRIKSH